MLDVDVIAVTVTDDVTLGILHNIRTGVTDVILSDISTQIVIHCFCMIMPKFQSY